MDLPVWQALYEELASVNLIVITVAMDSGGAADARRWIEAAIPTRPHAQTGELELQAAGLAPRGARQVGWSRVLGRGEGARRSTLLSARRRSLIARQYRHSAQRAGRICARPRTRQAVAGRAGL